MSNFANFGERDDLINMLKLRINFEYQLNLINYDQLLAFMKKLIVQYGISTEMDVIMVQIIGTTSNMNMENKWRIEDLVTRIVEI